MEQLQVFNEQEVLNTHFRMFGDKDNPLFLAKDVAEWIDYAKNPNGSYQVNKLVATVDEDEKLVVKVLLPGDTQKRQQTFLTEQGLYEVLMQSTKPIARDFKREVKAILKQIRQTGGAVVQGREEEFIKNYFPSFGEQTKLAMVLDLKTQNDAYKKQIEEQKPMVEGYETFLDADGLVTFEMCAKALGIGKNTLLKHLRDLKITQTDYYINAKGVKSAGEKNNVPYQKYMQYFVLKQVTIQNGKLVRPIIRLTTEGQEFVRRKLAEHNLI